MPRWFVLRLVRITIYIKWWTFKPICWIFGHEDCYRRFPRLGCYRCGKGITMKSLINLED